MHKNLILVAAILLLFACSKSDQEYVENCADQKTRPYWDSRAQEFFTDMATWGVKENLAKDKYEKKSAKKFYEYKKKLYENYKEAHKKKLDEKMFEFPRYKANFEKCGKEFKDNPVFFKQRYE